MLRLHSGLHCSHGSWADHCAKLLVRLPFVKCINNNGLVDIIKHDQLWVESLKANSERSRQQLDSEADNWAMSHITSVGVGSPPMRCKWLQHLGVDWKCLTKSFFSDNLIIDTERSMYHVDVKTVRLFESWLWYFWLVIQYTSLMLLIFSYFIYL